MIGFVGAVITLAALVSGGLWIFHTRRTSLTKAKAKATGDSLVKQAEDLARLKVKEAENNALAAVRAAEEKAHRDAKAKAAATRLRDYLNSRKGGGAN